MGGSPERLPAETREELSEGLLVETPTAEQDLASESDLTSISPSDLLALEEKIHTESSAPRDNTPFVSNSSVLSPCASPLIHSGEGNTGVGIDENIEPELNDEVSGHTRSCNKVCFQDIGTPTDRKWEWESVLATRFCLNHGEREMLLEYKDRWMRTSDFQSPRAEVVLREKFESYKQEPWTLNPLNRASQAGCRASLLSEVDTPLKRERWGDENIWLIRWSFRWTRESEVDDISHAEAAYENYRATCGSEQVPVSRALPRLG